MKINLKFTAWTAIHSPQIDCNSWIFGELFSIEICLVQFNKCRLKTLVYVHCAVHFGKHCIECIGCFSISQTTNRASERRHMLKTCEVRIIQLCIMFYVCSSAYHINYKISTIQISFFRFLKNHMMTDDRWPENFRKRNLMFY